LHVVVHRHGEVCWACARERDPDDWGLDLFEALLGRVIQSEARSKRLDDTNPGE